MKKIHISLFSAIVLVIILAALYGNLTGKNDPLFDQGTKTGLRIIFPKRNMIYRNLPLI